LVDLSLEPGVSSEDFGTRKYKERRAKERVFRMQREAVAISPAVRVIIPRPGMRKAAMAAGGES
jgi:hypothetical protein